MAETTSHKRTSIAQLIFIPALISLAVTIIRLIGERQHWPTALLIQTRAGPAQSLGLSGSHRSSESISR
jgi:hypothetical protein